MSDLAPVKGEIKDSVAKHWVGHYHPCRNFFCAQAGVPRLLEMLNPKPLCQRHETAFGK